MQELLSLRYYNQHVIPIYSYTLGPCVGSDQFLDSNDCHICKTHFSCMLTIDPRCKFASAEDYSPKPFPFAMRRPSSGWKCSQPCCWWEQGGDSITPAAAPAAPGALELPPPPAQHTGCPGLTAATNSLKSSSGPADTQVLCKSPGLST